MKIFYTKTYNLSGENEVKQSIVEKCAIELGFEEISLFKFPDQYDSDKELNDRMNGITSAIEDEAVVFFQYPSMVSVRYDRFFVDYLKRYQVKVIMLIQDFGSVVDPQSYSELREEIEIFNKADMLVLQSEGMECLLKKEGLRDIPIMYQEVWDYPFKVCKDSVNIERRLDSINDISVASLIGIESAGMALLSDFTFDYHDICNPLRTGFYVCAGIPILAKKYSQLEHFVKKYGIGFSVAGYEDANDIIQNISEGEIEQIRNNIRRIRIAISLGIFTKTLLQDALYRVLTDTQF